MKVHRPWRVLLVEDNPADIRLLREAFSDERDPHELESVVDGAEALDFVYRRSHYADKPRPDLILLDINLPKVDGHGVLAAIKAEPELMRIPVIMLTSSDSQSDVMKAYDRRANAYVQKPLDVCDYFRVVSQLTRFWLDVVQLPSIPASSASRSWR
jgi:chemotaxis family two-component system response regulator Rcp1